MSKKGVVGLAALWILLAVSVLSFSALSLGKWHLAKAHTQVQEVKSISLAYGAALIERENDFNANSRLHELSTGDVQIERQFNERKDEAHLACHVRCGGYEKDIEIGWRRIGGTWQAVSWTEL